jgi:hypothetical protein
MNAEIFAYALVIGLILYGCVALVVAGVRAVRARNRCVVKFCSAGWFHAGAANSYGLRMTCVTDAYPNGTELRVFNAAGKSVDVIVVPLREPFRMSESPRILLCREAFVALAPERVALLNVQVMTLECAKHGGPVRAHTMEPVLK